MPFWRTYYHLVWATKNREPLIQPAIERRLFSYLVNKANELEVRVYAINGWVDHVHLVVSIPPKHAVAYVVKRLKGASAFDLNQPGGLGGEFQWQRGYGVLTLGERQRPQAEAYVRNQKEHHGRQTTNSWLERVDEFDEGPPDEGLKPDVVLPVLHEAGVVYHVWGEDEFPF
ncbi:MAG: IS200/IS605 family transposase [Chloroflexi bacterium]|nr:IS200/IS605 family transposase [Chloroflexota bacterium]MCI0731513.1 IS200/IS605 family transposase [Chloroflexota bacterium]